MKESSVFFIKELAGEWPAFPGNPLVLATLSMKVFPAVRSGQWTE
ncbi:MAG: hypothetical protein V4739_08495 [Pseudomonadota bacterium]